MVYVGTDLETRKLFTSIVEAKGVKAGFCKMNRIEL